LQGQFDSQRKFCGKFKFISASIIAGYLRRVAQSEFGVKLRGLIQQKHKRPSHVAKKANQSPSVLSRIMSGDQKTLTPDTYSAIVRAVTDIPAEQAELLRAYLTDCCLGPGAELIEIRVNEKHASDTQIISRSLERAFSILRTLSAENPATAGLIVALADTLSRTKNGK
jgi:predicted transcriptional regulator